MDIGDVIEIAAAACHEANCQYGLVESEDEQPCWEHVQEARRARYRDGVMAVINNPSITPKGQHTVWMATRSRNGWLYGPIRDGSKKTHPCMTDYDSLPDVEKRKDALFIAVAKAVVGVLAPDMFPQQHMTVGHPTFHIDQSMDAATVEALVSTMIGNSQKVG